MLIWPASARGGKTGAGAAGLSCIALIKQLGVSPAIVVAHSFGGSVGATLACESGFRGGAAGVATVTAKLDIDYPFSGVFTLIGMDLTSVATQVRDQARVIGL